ncbi:hypothetical protein COV25_04425, partial [candidate division WWE3 bacterium CG10_big_fil_rev_8_21_14_0_10_35_32]
MIFEDTGASADQKKKFINTDGGLLSIGKFSDAMVATAQMVINTSGNVGIGTTSPGAFLEVAGSGASAGQMILHGTTPDIITKVSGVEKWQTVMDGSKWGIYNSGLAAYNFWIQQSTGNVGIGTTGPGAKLEVYASTTPDLNINFGTASSYGRLVFQEGGVAKNVIQSIGSTFATADRRHDLEMQSVSGDISFWPAGVQQVTFKSGGNVGIGTTGPGAKLDVDGLMINGSTNPSISDGGTLRKKLEWLGATNSWGVYNSNDSGSNWQSNLFIEAGGNVGIGTTAPGAKLHLYADDSTLTLGQKSSALILEQFNATASGVGSEIQFQGKGPSRATKTYASITGSLVGSSVAVGSYGDIVFSNKALAADTSLTERLIIKTSGNIGIGTTNPGQKLSLYIGSAGFSGLSNNGLSMQSNTHQYIQMFTPANTQQGILFGGGANNESRILWEDGTRGNYLDISGGTIISLNGTNGGNVGIGTTGPGVKLQVDAPSPAINLGQFFISGTEATGAVDTGGGILFGGHDGSVAKGWTTIQGLKENSTVGNYASYLRFATRANGGAIQEQVRITSSGNVGIGTTGPSELLQVGFGSGSSVRRAIRIGDGYGLNLQNRTNSDADSAIFQNAYIVGGSGTSSTYDWTTTHGSFGSRGLEFSYLRGISFYADNVATTADSSFTPTARMVILNNGNVGIGTTTPGAKLQVGLAGSNAIRISSATAGISSLEFLNTAFSASARSIQMGTDGKIKITSTAGADQFAIDNSGNVGIGTTGPTSLLSLGSNAVISRGTSDGADNDVLKLSGGGLAASSRGAVIQLFGNEHATSPGQLYLAGGESSYVAVNGGISAGSYYATTPPSNGMIISGNVGIGTTGPSVALDVVGDIEYTGTITDVSDIRLKENFEPIVNPLGIINGLQGLKFNMIGSNIREVGLIAQDVQNVLPEAVRVVDPENGYLGVSYPSLIPVLIEGIKEQQGQISLLSGQMSSFASVLSVSAGGTGGDGLNGQGNVGAVRIDGHCVTGDTMLPIRRRKR